MNSEEKIPHGWIKVKSKSRPDKFYYFHTEKNLSVWRFEDIQNAAKVIAAANGHKKLPKKSPHKSIARVSDASKRVSKRNIAEDRMKKIRRNLAEEAKRGIGDWKQKEERKPGEASKSVSNGVQASKQESNNVLKSQELNNSEEKMDIDECSLDKIEKLPEIEPMEWEEIDQKVAVEEVLIVRSKECDKTSVNCTSKRILSSDSEFYIIVDTNVLLSNLKFVRDIKGKDFKDIGKAVIYLPYVVLCELDRLKMREETVARQARAAINYINNCFSDKDDFLIGQSALESSREIIEIDNGDDYIINSSLQMKEITNKIIVLSNDKNLRNKVAVNELEAFSSDMLNDAKFNAGGKIKFE